MTRKEITTIVLEANPQLNRAQRLLVKITSPVTYAIGQRAARKQVALLCEVWSLEIDTTEKK